MSEPIASTDDVRSAAPLKYARRLTFDAPVKLERGGCLPHVHCAYETWGTLREDASNAILICHAISGDSHAASHDEDDDPGWWESLIGRGKAIDTDRFFVVCPNVLGGCRGTTGPGDINPDSDPPRPYGSDFPRITVGDIVMVQRMLAESLGIERWRAVVGGSLGGHQAMDWATRYPDWIESCVIIAASARLTSQALGFDVIARNAIQTDPHFAGGQYYDQPNRPDTGLAIARMLGHITYLSGTAMEAKFDPDRHDPRQIASIFEQQFSVGSYLAHQGHKFTTRFDANSYMTLSSVLDLGCGDGHLLAALKERGNVNVMGVEVDGPSLIRSARRGLDVIDYDLNQGLPAFIDGQFDVVILGATLQAVANVEDLFDEMIRVGKQVIISFPNFAYRALREDYVARGRSPKARGQYHYEWYNTPNRRFPTVADVHDLCRQKGIRIEREVYFDSATNQQIPSDDDPNLNADTAILAVTG